MSGDGTFDLSREAYAFVHEARAADDAASLNTAFGQRVRTLGFDQFLCIHFPGPNSPPQELFGEWDRRWATRYISRNYHRHDPVRGEMLRRDEPFAWSDISDRRLLTPDEELVMADARAYGAHNGFVTPFRNMDGTLSNVTLFARKCDLSEDARTSLHIMSLYFGGAARRLQRASAGEPDHVALSPREREVVSYLATGHTQAAVAAKLNLSPRTVETLVLRARERFGVLTTTQLCVEAVRTGAVRL